METLETIKFLIKLIFSIIVFGLTMRFIINLWR